MTKRRLVSLAVLALPALAIGGCSLVNSFGDVVPAGSEGDGGGAADASTGQDRTVPPTPDAAPDALEASPPPVDAPVTIEASSDTGTIVDAGGVDSADGAPRAPAGALVVGGNASADGGFILTSLDPATGLELAPSLREAMTVVAVQYDGLRDLWYIFENTGVTGLFPTPTDTVYLHVRVLDTHTGVWAELAKLKVPAIVSTDTVAVLNRRLAYTAYALNDAGVFAGGYEMVLVDTSTPGSPAVITPSTPLTIYPTGVIGTRNPSAAGGTINMLHVDQTACQGDGSAELCELNVIHATVPNVGGPVISPTPIPVGAVPATQGTEGFGSFLGGGPDDIIGFPPANGAPGAIQRFSPPTSNAIAGSRVSFGIQSPFMKAIAVSECYATAFVVAVPGDTSIYGVPLTGATTTILSQDLGHAAQAVRFEPFTSTVVAPFKANGSWALIAYRLGGSQASPTLTKRIADWNPPADLEPNFVGVRQPIPFTCTTP